jgi:hypothetical protein
MAGLPNPDLWTWSSLAHLRREQGSQLTKQEGLAQDNERGTLN